MSTVSIEAKPEDVGMSSRRLQNVTRLVQSYIDDGKYAGAISLVARRDKVVHFETYGMMDAEAGRPMQPDTIFRIASMTKPIASVALMTLYEEGHFQLDTPVYEFIPEFRDVKVFAGGTADSYDVRSPARAMTIRDILTHTSGLESLAGVLEGVSPVAQLYARSGIKNAFQASGTLAETARTLAALPLVDDPGTRFSYNFATELVGRVCEVVAGEAIDTFLKERLFAPLGMFDTTFRVQAATRERLAMGYDHVAGTSGPRYQAWSDDLRDERYATEATFRSMAGGLLSTAADYLRFCRMLQRGGELDGIRILGPHTVRYMTANHLPGGADLPAMGAASLGAQGVGFGLGFAVVEDPVRAGTLGSPGEYYWGGAFSTIFFISPVDELIVISMSQLAPPAAYPIRRQLRTTIYSAITD